MTATTDDYFDEQWRDSVDPWEQRGRWYEQRKFDLTVAALPRAHYSTAFEPGCGAGFLTERLAGRVDRLIAMERSAEGVEATRARCGPRHRVDVLRGRIPGDWPDGRFDLIVLSEVLYYLDDADLDEALARTRSGLADDGDVVAVHFRQEVPEHARLGDEVHQILRARFGAATVRHEETDFLLEVFGFNAGLSG